MKSKPLKRKCVVLVCTGSACQSRGCKRVHKRLCEVVAEQDAEHVVRVQRTRCMGHCEEGPNVMAFPLACLYTGVRRRDAASIVAESMGVERSVPAAEDATPPTAP